MVNEVYKVNVFNYSFLKHLIYFSFSKHIISEYGTLFLIQVDNTLKLCSDTDIHEEVVKRFNIPLSWLDIKRVQDPVDPGEKVIINDATSRSEKKFIPG